MHVTPLCFRYEDGLKLLQQALQARGGATDEHAARILAAQAKIKMRQLQLLQEYVTGPLSLQLQLMLCVNADGSGT